jgi:LacI family transcriptional regulator
MSSTPTLKDVAALAGVSFQTAAHILDPRQRKTHLFAPDTRERVRQAAEKVGYRPNSAARAIKTGRFGAVGLVMSAHSSRSVIDYALLWGMQDELHAAGLRLVVDRRADDLADAEAAVGESATDGMLVFYTHAVPPAVRVAIAAQRQPAVWVNVRLAHDCVNIDDVGGVREATARLIDLGHRRITMLAGQPNDHASRADRIEGYRLAMEGAGLPPQVVETLPTDADGLDLRPLLSAPTPPTAIVAETARQALATYVAALRLGWVLPRDLSLVAVSGHGDLVDLGGRPATTIALPWEALGRAAVRALVPRFGTQRRKAPPVVVPCSLLPGSTMGPPPERVATRKRS